MPPFPAGCSLGRRCLAPQSPGLTTIEVCSRPKEIAFAGLDIVSQAGDEVIPPVLAVVVALKAWR